jgi:hypothetical protein
VNALHTVSELAEELGIEEHLHLWPDKSPGSQALANRLRADPRFRTPHSTFDIQAWLDHWWLRVSEWPM